MSCPSPFHLLLHTRNNLSFHSYSVPNQTVCLTCIAVFVHGRTVQFTTSSSSYRMLPLTKQVCLAGSCSVYRLTSQPHQLHTCCVSYLVLLVNEDNKKTKKCLLASSRSGFCHIWTGASNGCLRFIAALAGSASGVMACQACFDLFGIASSLSHLRFTLTQAHSLLSSCAKASRFVSHCTEQH